MPYYSKIQDASKHTPAELLKDLRVRATHYAEHARKTATRKIHVDNNLAIATAILSVVASAALTLFQAKFVSEDWTIVIGIAASLIAAAISVFRQFLFDGKVSAHTLQISMRFYRIRESIMMIEAANEIEHYSNKILLSRYSTISGKYSQLREQFIIYTNSHSLYYWRTPDSGRIERGIFD